MSHRILRYESDGEERFAVWSTVVDEWIVVDMDQRQLTEWYLGKEARKAHEHITRRVEELRDGENPYAGWMPVEKRKELIALMAEFHGQLEADDE